MKKRNQYKKTETKQPSSSSSGKTLQEITQQIVSVGNTMDEGKEGCARFIEVLRQSVRWAGVNWVAKQAKMPRHQLDYAVGRKDADPRFSTVVKLLRTFGIKLVFVVKDISSKKSKNTRKKNIY